MMKDKNKTAWQYASDLVAKFPTANTPMLMQKMRMLEYANDNTTENDLKAARFDALILVDVQERYCNPDKGRGTADTEATAKHIGTLIPHFRKAGLPIYGIYFNHHNLKAGQTDFHHYRPASTDRLHMKRDNSAFAGANGKNLDQLLKSKQHKNLLIMGFNASACLLETVEDAQNLGYNCTIAADAVGNDKHSGKNITRGLSYLFNAHCVSFITSEQALCAVQGDSIYIPMSKSAKPSHHILDQITAL